MTINELINKRDKLKAELRQVNDEIRKYNIETKSLKPIHFIQNNKHHYVLSIESMFVSLYSHCDFDIYYRGKLVYSHKAYSYDYNKWKNEEKLIRNTIYKAMAE